jgi:hypothetical protein
VLEQQLLVFVQWRLHAVQRPVHLGVLQHL